MDIQKIISNQIEDLLQKNPQGLNITGICRAVHIPRNTAIQHLEHLLQSGRLEVQTSRQVQDLHALAKGPPLPVLSISSDSVILLDYFLRIIFANEPFLNLIGTTSKKMVGKISKILPLPGSLMSHSHHSSKNSTTGLREKNGPGRLRSVQSISSSFAGSSRSSLMTEAGEYPLFLKISRNGSWRSGPCGRVKQLPVPLSMHRQILSSWWMHRE